MFNFFKKLNKWIESLDTRTLVRHSETIKISYSEFFALPKSVKAFDATFVKTKTDTWIEAKSIMLNPSLEQILKLLNEDKNRILVYECCQNEASMYVTVYSRMFRHSENGRN